MLFHSSIKLIATVCDSFYIMVTGGYFLKHREKQASEILEKVNSNKEDTVMELQKLREATSTHHSTLSLCREMVKWNIFKRLAFKGTL